MAMVKRILVFDDDKNISSIIQYILEEKGWEVVCSHNSNDAVEKIKTTQPTIIMMDNNIPDIGGVVTVQRIKLEKELQHIPIIFFTASSDAESLANEAGADACLPKPFDLEKLYNVIESLLPLPVDGN
jgi:DNA-binding response OmpR family regulator